MYFVYRYTDIYDGIIKYVGITCREQKNSVMKRADEHFRQDDWFRMSNWKIDVIQCKSKTDANCLESHFIYCYKTWKYYNKAKINHGICEFVPSDIETKWIHEDFYYALEKPQFKFFTKPKKNYCLTIETKKEETMTIKEVCEIAECREQTLRVCISNNFFDWAEAISGDCRNKYVIYKEKFFNSKEYKEGFAWQTN